MLTIVCSSAFSLFFRIFHIISAQMKGQKNTDRKYILSAASVYNFLVEFVIAFFERFKGHGFAVFVFYIGVFQLLAEAFAEISKIFLPQFFLFCLFCLIQAFFPCLFCKKVYSFNSFVHKNSPF